MGGSAPDPPGDDHELQVLTRVSHGLEGGVLPEVMGDLGAQYLVQNHRPHQKRDHSPGGKHDADGVDRHEKVAFPGFQFLAGQNLRIPLQLFLKPSKNGPGRGVRRKPDQHGIGGPDGGSQDSGKGVITHDERPPADESGTIIKIAQNPDPVPVQFGPGPPGKGAVVQGGFPVSLPGRAGLLITAFWPGRTLERSVSYTSATAVMVRISAIPGRLSGIIPHQPDQGLSRGHGLPFAHQNGLNSLLPGSSTQLDNTQVRLQPAKGMNKYLSFFSFFLTNKSTCEIVPAKRQKSKSKEDRQLTRNSTNELSL